MRNYVLIVPLLLSLIVGLSSDALSDELPVIEGMSSEEKIIRERLDLAQKELYKCFAEHDVGFVGDSNNVCLDEQEKYRVVGEEFNAFMRDKDAKTSIKERRGLFEKLVKKYKVFSEEELLKLHRKYCQTKWGSSDSPDCNAIASQISKKKFMKSEGQE